MQDIHTLYKKSGSRKVFHNFFRSSLFNDAYTALESSGLRPEQIIVKTHSARNTPSQTLAHPLVAIAFLQWCDTAAYNKTLLKLINNMPTTENTPPERTAQVEEFNDE